MMYPLNDDIATEIEKMRKAPGIVFAWGSFERVPRIAGTGIEVFEVISVYKAVDGDWERLKRVMNFLNEDQLHSALTFYHEFPDEVNARLDEEDRAFEELKRERARSEPPSR